MRDEYGIESNDSFLLGRILLGTECSKHINAGVCIHVVPPQYQHAYLSDMSIVSDVVSADVGCVWHCAEMQLLLVAAENIRMTLK